MEFFAWLAIFLFSWVGFVVFIAYVLKRLR